MGNKESFIMSKRELDIMNVLWESEDSLIASEIPGIKPEISLNTVQSVLRQLLKKKFVKVAKIVQSGTVLSRSFAPAISPDEYALTYVKTAIYPFQQFVSKELLFELLVENAENPDELIHKLKDYIVKRHG